MTTSYGHFLFAILNDKTTYLVRIIYRTIIYRATNPLIFTLHYPYLITQWGTSLFPNVFGTTKGKGNIHIFQFSFPLFLSLDALLPFSLPLKASLNQLSVTLLMSSLFFF